MVEGICRVSVARDFSVTPGPRYIKQGPHSGEKFRNSILLKSLKECTRLEVDLDGTAGYGSSFIDEAFGGLVRENGFNATDLKRRLTIVSKEDPSLIHDVFAAINEALPKAG